MHLQSCGMYACSFPEQIINILQKFQNTFSEDLPKLTFFNTKTSTSNYNFGHKLAWWAKILDL